MIARSTIRNLRPRKNLVNYAEFKKRMLSVNAGPSAFRKSNVSDTKTTSVSDFVEATRQIKIEQIDESKRNLRPRRTVVDYQEPKMRKVSEYRAKRRKMDEQGMKLHSKNKSALNALNFKIKQETLDDLNIVLSETINVTSRLPSKFATLPAKIEAKTSDNDVNLRDDYLKSQSRGQFRDQLVERKSLSNIVKNRLTKTKKTYRLPTANYSPKCLRSQDAYLRNGKTRKNDYAEWSMKKLQTRKLMDINKGMKKSPMLKLSENIKHYCETCNISFMNTELFRLHACYCD